MTCLADYQEFLTDKQSLVLGGTTRHNYAFLAKNRLLIQQEFDHLYETIDKSEGVPQDIWRRFYHYTGLLDKYYVAHDEPNKAASYRRKAAQLTFRHNAVNNQNESVFLNNVQTILGIENEPDALGKLYKFWGNANMQRLEFTFGRVTVKQALLLASNLQWADSPISVSDMVSVIDAPAPIFNALSLGLFACRFSINISQIIKHTWFPTAEENDGSLTACERFCQEVYDRQYHLLNDLVWFSANLFCNYNAYWNLSDLFAGQLTAIFLVFDALWLVWSRHLIEETYLIKKEQYLAEKVLNNTQIHQTTQEGVFDSQHLSKLILEDTLLDQQLAELELEWQKNNANYLFSIAAAAVFTAGYSATMLFAAQAAIVFSFFMCSVAVAMYLSADEWATYRQKAYVLGLDKTSKKAESELDAARNAFICAMLQNTFIPLLVTTCFALCWPAALAVTVLYLSNYLLSEKSEPSMPALGAATADNDEDSDSDDEDDEQTENVRLIG